MSIESSSSSFLPKDLLIEILLCLPVKTLLRIKSVCKSWFALIDSSDFIDRHVAFTTSSSTKLKLGTFIFQSMHSYEKQLDVSWNHFSISGNHEFQVYEDLGMPPCYRKPMNLFKNNIIMVGSCNGIICLYDKKLKDVSLWNPAIHQFRLLPKSLTFAGIGNVDPNRDFAAFGFDVETKDYKVVLVTFFFQPRTEWPEQQCIQPRTEWPEKQCIHSDSSFRLLYRVQVYNLSADSWRSLEDVVLPTETMPFLQSPAGYLNGSYYCLGSKWIKSYTDCRKHVLDVLSFDFTKEIFKLVPLPDELNNRSIYVGHINIVFSSEKIAICDRKTCYEIYDLWVLNHEVLGVKENWTKLYKIETNQRPIGISNDGEFIFIVGKQLWLLNPSTQVKMELQWDGNQIKRACVYRQSLVPVCNTRNGSISELSQV